MGPAAINVPGAEVEVEASFTAEIPPKYRDKSLWVCLRLGFGFDASGGEEDEPLALAILLALLVVLV